MNKAFTKEDDDERPDSKASPLSIPTSPFRLTADGAKRLAGHADPRVRAALLLAEVLPPAADVEVASLGAMVRVRHANGEERIHRLVSSEERALLGDGCSVVSPVGRALLGARAGDVREIALPGGVEEVEVVSITRTPP